MRKVLRTWVGRWSGPAILIITAVALTAAVAQDRRESEAALEAVRSKIKAFEAKVARETEARAGTAKALRAAELDTAAANRELTALRAKLDVARRSAQLLRADTTRASARLGAERSALGQQVRASYITGRQELYRLVLSQEDPATLGRMLVYFDYYNRARAARIAAVAAEVAQLAALGQESERVQAELVALEARQASEVDGLARGRDERRRVVAEIEAELRDAQASVAKLRAEEARLTDLVKRLNELAVDFPVDGNEPFARWKGELAWPVQGKLVGDYGQPRGTGAVRWSGVLIETAAGTPVKAVYHGRIAFADWLPGLGLLLIVDHGGGYMSLYGHNEALLKESGDWVVPGEAIAQVGDTGGQARPGLYFELRFRGEPIDPRPWIGARPVGR